jgi:TonB family protein
VTVRVTIDGSGAVVSDTLVRAGPSKYFARLASESARRWRFGPSAGAGSRQSQIRFDFARSGTTARVVSSDKSE